jgi:hypothetical protein
LPIPEASNCGPLWEDKTDVIFETEEEPEANEAKKIKVFQIVFFD